MENPKNRTLRWQIFHLLNPNDKLGFLSNAFNISIICLILVNVLAASLETVESLQAAYGKIFSLIEKFSVLIFSIEYILRFWSISEDEKYPTRLHFLFSFDSIIDLLAVAPFYLGYFFGVNLRALIALRLLRLLKLIRYFEPLAILATVLKTEFRAFMAAMFVLVILVFITSTGIYFFEKQAQPDVFGSIPQSMWWAIVTLTTLGYGDVVPVTIAGKIFAAMITILSLGTVALPAGMLASRFSEELKKRKISLGQQISVLSSDGALTLDDKKVLEQYRKKLCLSEDDMEKLFEERKKILGSCPLCGKEHSHGE